MPERDIPVKGVSIRLIRVFTGCSSQSLPSSTSFIAAAAVNTFVMDAIRLIASGLTAGEGSEYSWAPAAVAEYASVSGHQEARPGSSASIRFVIVSEDGDPLFVIPAFRRSSIFPSIHCAISVLLFFLIEKP